MATKKEEKNELATTYAGLDFAADAAQDKGISADDCTIPRLSIIQSSSPQCKMGNEKYDESAKQGDIYDSVNSRYYSGKDGIKIIPVTYAVNFIEWKDRDSGGGFVTNHGDNPSVLDATEKNDKFKDVLPNGNLIVRTHEYHVLVVGEDGTTSPFVISMSASQLKVSKKWNSMISLAKRQLPGGKEGQMFSPAMYFISYNLKTIPESNAKGDSYMNYSVTTAEDVITIDNGVEIYGEAASLEKVIKAGQVKTQSHSSDEDSDEL